MKIWHWAIVAVLVLTLALIAVLFQVCRQLTTRPDVPRSQQEQSTPAEPNVPRPQRELSVLLTELDTLGGLYKSTMTTVQKEELRKRALMKGRELTEGREMTLYALVKDVRIPRDGVASLTLDSLDLGAYGQVKKRNLGIGTDIKVSVPLSRAEAAKISAGTKVELRGTPVFREGSGGPIVDGIASSAVFITFNFHGDATRLGSLRLEPYTVKILPSATTNP